MKTSLDSIRNGLVSQLAELESELESATAQVVQLKATRRQVVAAVKALAQDANASHAAKTAPKKKQVRQAVEQLLADNDRPIPMKDLEQLVAEKLLTEQGCSAMGLALRMREVLASDDYSIDEGQVQKKEASGSTVGTSPP